MPLTALGIPLPGCTGWSSLLPYQRDLILCQARIVIAQWGRGCGKTSTLWLLALLDALRFPGLRTLVIAPAYKVLTDGLFPVIANIDTTYKQLFGHSLIRKWCKSTSINRLDLINGSSFTFRSTSNIDSLRGGTYGNLLIEEAGYIDATPGSWAAFAPVLRGYGPGRILCGGTPQGTAGVLGVLLELARQDASIRVSRAATTDNPHFNPLQLELLRATLSPEMWRGEILGEVTAPTGLVYPEFDRIRNVIDFPPSRLLAAGWEVFELVDWGFAQAHRLTIAVRQLDRTKLPTVVVLRDIPVDRKDAGGICRDIVGDFNKLPIQPRALVTDSRGFVENGVARRMLSQYGKAVVFEKDLNRTRVDKTCEYVRRALSNAAGEPSLFVTNQVLAADCNRPGGKGIVQSFENYRLEEVRAGSGTYKNKPIDDNKHTHSMDAIRYFYVNMHKFGYSWPVTLQDVVAEKRINQYA